jgi:hypothetical protein
MPFFILVAYTNQKELISNALVFQSRQIAAGNVAARNYTMSECLAGVAAENRVRFASAARRAMGKAAQLRALRRVELAPWRNAAELGEALADEEGLDEETVAEAVQAATAGSSRASLALEDMLEGKRKGLLIGEFGAWGRAGALGEALADEEDLGDEAVAEAVRATTAGLARAGLALKVKREGLHLGEFGAWGPAGALGEALADEEGFGDEAVAEAVRTTAAGLARAALALEGKRKILTAIAIKRQEARAPTEVTGLGFKRR